MSSCPCPKQTRTRTQDFFAFGHGLGHGPCHDFRHDFRHKDSELRKINLAKMNYAFFKKSYQNCRLKPKLSLQK